MLYYSKTGSVLTFSHVSITGDGTFFSSLLTGASSRKANETNAFFEVSFAMKFQDGNVIVQSLRIVIVMDVSSCNSQSLRPGAAILLSQVMITYADVNGISGTYNTEIKLSLVQLAVQRGWKKVILGHTVSCSQDPLGTDQGSAAQVLVQGIDEGHLPTPFAGCCVFAPDDPTGSVGSFDATDVFIGDWVLQSRLDGSDLRLRYSIF